MPIQDIFGFVRGNAFLQCFGTIGQPTKFLLEGELRSLGLLLSSGTHSLITLSLSLLQCTLSAVSLLLCWLFISLSLTRPCPLRQNPFEKFSPCPAGGGERRGRRLAEPTRSGGSGGGGAGEYGPSILLPGPRLATQCLAATHRPFWPFCSSSSSSVRLRRKIF